MLLLDALAASPALFVVTWTLLGLVVGSFLNVVIYRVPVMLEREWREHCAELSRDPLASKDHPGPRERFDLVVPRSACPACHAPIKAYQNIPIVSYVALRGRCAACGAGISMRYPLVEALTGLCSAVIALRFGFGWPAAAALVYTWFLIALTFIDLDRQLLPDNLTLPLLWLGLTLSLSGLAAGHDGGRLAPDLRSSLIGAIAGYVSLWGVYHAFRLITGKEGMGYGDFKLFAAIGAWLGWQVLPLTILLAAGVGAIVGVVMILAKRARRETPIPFGPFLAAAGWLALLYGHEIVARYFGPFAPS
jgi:leader peptidase (prepilin peptidase)/N-methyltransferase